MGPLKLRCLPSYPTPQDPLTTPLLICLLHARSQAQHSPHMICIHMICMDLQHKPETRRLISPRSCRDKIVKPWASRLHASSRPQMSQQDSRECEEILLPSPLSLCPVNCSLCLEPLPFLLTLFFLQGSYPGSQPSTLRLDQDTPAPWVLPITVWITLPVPPATCHGHSGQLLVCFLQGLSYVFIFSAELDLVCNWSSENC